MVYTGLLLNAENSGSRFLPAPSAVGPTSLSLAHGATGPQLLAKTRTNLRNRVNITAVLEARP